MSLVRDCRLVDDAPHRGNQFFIGFTK